MPVNWDQFEEIDEAPAKINWDNFEPVEDEPRPSKTRTEVEQEVETATLKRNPPPPPDPNPIRNAVLQAGAGVTKGLFALGEGVTQAGALAADLVLPAFPKISQNLQGHAQRARETRQAVEQVAAEDPGSETVRQVAEGGTSMLQVLGPGGLVGGAVRGGIQSGLLTLTEAQDKLAETNDPATARAKAVGPSLANALITFAVTKAGGNTGVEAITSLVKSGTWREGIRTILKNAGFEATEEMVDSLGSSAVEAITYNPDLTVAEAFNEAVQSGKIGGIIGTGVSSLGQVAGAIAKPPPIPIDPTTAQALPKASQALNKTISETELIQLEAKPLTPGASGYDLKPSGLELEPLPKEGDENDPLKSKFTEFAQTGTETATDQVSEVRDENGFTPEEVAQDRQIYDQLRAEATESGLSTTPEIQALKNKHNGMAPGDYTGGQGRPGDMTQEEADEFLRSGVAQNEALQKKSQTESTPENVKQSLVEDQARETGQAESELIGMGGAVPAEFIPNPNSQTSIRNASVDEARIKRGLEPIAAPFRKALGQSWDEASEIIDGDALAGERKVNDVLKNPQAGNDVDMGLILHRRTDVENAYEKAASELENSIGQDPDVRATKQKAADELLEELERIEQAAKSIGTQTARGLNARKTMINRDFSLARMMLDKKVSKGGEPLTETEKAEIKETHDVIAKAEAEFEALNTKLEAEEVQKQAERKIDEILTEPDPDIEPRVKSLAERIVASLEKEADAARKRIKARLARVSVGVDPLLLKDAAIIGSYHLSKGLLQFSKWSKAMITDIGQQIEPFLKEIWDASNADQDKRASRKARSPEEKEKVKRVVTKVGTEERKNATVESIKTKVTETEKGQNPEISNLVQKLARNFVAMGEKTRQGLINSVHAELEPIIPGITKRETLEAISGYGKFKQLTKDEVSVQLRDLKGQMQQVAKLEDMEAGQAPKKTGVERRTPSTEEHRLILQVNEAKRKGGYNVTDPATQLKSALGAIKTRLRNEITDLSDQLASKSKIVKTKTTTPYDVEAKTLLAKRNALKQQFDAMFGKPGITDEQRIKSATESIQKSINELEKRIASKDISSRQQVSKTPQTPEIVALKNRRDILQKEMDKLRDLANPKKTPEERSISAYRTRLKNEIDSLQKQITTKIKTPQIKKATPSDPENDALKAKRDKLKEEFDSIFGKPQMTDAQRLNLAMKAVERSITDLETRIKNNDLAPRKKGSKVPPSAVLDAAKARQKALNAQLKLLRDIANPKKTKQEIAEQAYITRTENKIADMEDRMARGDYAPKPKQTLDLSKNPKAIQLKAKVEQKKAEYKKARHFDMLKHRSKWEKTWDMTKQILHLNRTFITGWEISAVLNQGGFYFFGNPIKATRNIKTSLETLSSEQKAQENQEQIRLRPNWVDGDYARARLYLPSINEYESYKMEEDRMTTLADNIPGLRASNRSYVSLLNKIRADNFDGLVKLIDSPAYPINDASKKVIANFINIHTGRGNLGGHAKAAETLAALFFSPRFWASRIQLALGQPLWTGIFSGNLKGTLRARAAIGFEYVKAGMLLTTIYALLGMRGGEREDDSLASTFGKVRIGPNTWIDLTLGMGNVYTLIARLVSGKYKTQKGKIRSIRGEDHEYFDKGAWDVITDYGRYKLSPNAANVVDALGLEDAIGDKMTIKKFLVNQVAPLTYRDFFKLMEDNGIPKGIILQLLGVPGARINVHDERDKSKTKSSNYRPN